MISRVCVLCDEETEKWKKKKKKRNRFVQGIGTKRKFYQAFVEDTLHNIISSNVF